MQGLGPGGQERAEELCKAFRAKAQLSAPISDLSSTGCFHGSREDHALLLEVYEPLRLHVKLIYNICVLQFCKIFAYF